MFAIPPARLAAVPVVIASIRDRGPYLSPMQLRVQRMLCRAATCVAVNAGAVRDWLIGQGYDAGRIAVIPNGVDLEPLRRSGRSRGDPPRPRGGRQGAAGDGRVEAASPQGPRNVSRRGRDLSLRVSPTPAFSWWGRRARTIGTIRGRWPRGRPGSAWAAGSIFAGLRDDVPALLAASTVSVMPSLNEALSNVLLESMAAAAPTVATRVGGTPEAIDDGVTGLLVPPGDAAALAEAVGRLIDDPARAAALGRAARETVERRFSLRRMVDDTERLYLRLLRQARVRTRAA